MSTWSVWSQCSCESQRQQRYRVALTSATRGQQCTPVETHSRACSLHQCDDGEIKTILYTCPTIASYCFSLFLSAYIHNCFFLHSDITNKTLWINIFIFHLACEAPFVYVACGAPCEKHCALTGSGDLCLGARECTPGCYCPEVSKHLISQLYFFLILAIFQKYDSTVGLHVFMFIVIKPFNSVQ